MLLSLCRLFENLVQRFEPEVFYHLLDLGIQPLQVAFQWIQFAFAGYLEPQETLLLWDRVIGFDRLELLPILAASIFLYRAASLVQCRTADDVRDVFSDPSKIKVIPLLQHFLFSHEMDKLYPG